ncbi:hypothetical protein A9762_11505 [Pandoraea sp. ISTKB]|nr:hypothetical protein A9762_11505 [Pandoraea sp. ISTKB]
MKRIAGYKLRNRETRRSESETTSRARGEMHSIKPRFVKGGLIATVALFFVMGITDPATYSWLKSLASAAFSSAIHAWHL